MAHQRFRKFNTRDMYPEQSLNNDVCMAVRAGNRVFLRGQTGFDLDGKFHGLGDPRAQSKMAMTCVKTLLEEAGAKMEHICKLTVYINDRAHRDAVYQEIGRWTKGIHPCQTGLIISGFAKPEMLMEVDVEAIIPDEEA